MDTIDMKFEVAEGSLKEANDARIHEFAAKLPAGLKWTEQAIRSLCDCLNVRQGVHVGSVDSISFDGEKVDIGFQDCGSRRKQRCVATLSELNDYSLKNQGVPEDMVLNSSKYEILQHVIKARPELVKLVGSVDSFYGAATNILIVHPELGLPLERLGVDDMPLTDAEKEILTYEQQVDEARQRVYKATYTGPLVAKHLKLRDAGGLAGFVDRHWSKSKEFKTLRDTITEGDRLGSSAFDLQKQLNNTVFSTKAEGNSIVSIPNELRKQVKVLLEKADSYLKKAGEVIAQYDLNG